MKGFKERVAEKVKMDDGRYGYFFSSSSGRAPAKIKIFVEDRSHISTKKTVRGARINTMGVGVKANKTNRSFKRNSGMVSERKKIKKKSPTPEFLILSERLKEAAKLKASGNYRDRDLINW